MTWRKTLSEDPWRNLPAPAAAEALSARRVDATKRFDFFWATGADRRCLLILKHRAESSPTGRFPRLEGIEVVLVKDEGHDAETLVLRLLDNSQRDLFFRFCVDIVESTQGSANEREAVAATLKRTWRWHHLLRGGGDGRLSLEEQKGLFGELLVLKRLLQKLSPRDAVQSWRGPLGAPKDFEIGRNAIEAKARKGAAVPLVAIASEHQLDTSGIDTLVLLVFELDQSLDEGAGGASLSEIASVLQREIEARDPEAGAHFESLLLAAGFDWAADYSDVRWSMGRERAYHVCDHFPRVTPSCFPTGVVGVRYSISLPDCEAFLVNGREVDRLLGIEGDGH